MDVENKNVEPNMVKLAREIYMKKNKGNFNNFIYGRASGKFAGCKKKKQTYYEVREWVMKLIIMRIVTIGKKMLQR